MLTYAGPVSNDAVTVTFNQHISANDALRTGTYSKTLTFTLSTTQPVRSSGAGRPFGAARAISRRSDRGTEGRHRARAGGGCGRRRMRRQEEASENGRAQGHRDVRRARADGSGRASSASAARTCSTARSRPSPRSTPRAACSGASSQLEIVDDACDAAGRLRGRARRSCPTATGVAGVIGGDVRRGRPTARSPVDRLDRHAVPGHRLDGATTLVTEDLQSTLLDDRHQLPAGAVVGVLDQLPGGDAAGGRAGRLAGVQGPRPADDRADRRTRRSSSRCRRSSRTGRRSRRSPRRRSRPSRTSCCGPVRRRRAASWSRRCATAGFKGTFTATAASEDAGVPDRRG